VATAALPVPAFGADADRYKYRYIIAITVSLASVLELLSPASSAWRAPPGFS